MNRTSGGKSLMERDNKRRLATIYNNMNNIQDQNVHNNGIYIYNTSEPKL